MTTSIVTLKVPGGVPGTSADDLAARCWALGCIGIEERDGSIRATFATRHDADTAATVLADHMTGAIEAVDDPLAGWTAPMVAVDVGRFVIRPVGGHGAGDVPGGGPDRFELTIDPGRAFGSGSHPSTRAALHLLSRGSAPQHVLDVGTGTGILSIGAARIGAASVRAIDVDQAAVDIALVNVTANGVESIVAVEQTPIEAVDGRYDLVLVNVTIDHHEDLAAAITARLDNLGAVVAAGVLAGAQEARLERCYQDLVVTDRYHDGEWAALRLERSPDPIRTGSRTVSESEGPIVADLPGRGRNGSPVDR